jgi:hypothetical protein
MAVKVTKIEGNSVHDYLPNAGSAAAFFQGNAPKVDLP